MKTTLYKSILVIGAAALISACNSSKDDKDSNKSSASMDATSLDSFYVDTAPANASQISEVFADPTPGREIVLSGEIMGRKHPFVEGRAMVLLGDPTKITPCNRIPGDECTTPWDTCCDDPEVLKKSITTIQFLDSDGKIVKTNLKGYKGIKEQSFLTVKGTIAEGSNANNLLVNAEAFHLTEPSPYVNAPPAANYGEIEGGTITEEDGVFIYEKN